ncbi:tRNA (adenosine(37)-N6)-threonylcarbamoyltransferase complex ATPase subunit type 1 TsaE [Mesobaculum littorinae]|uniref:tRNA threonylcarbamoyladenosine biosynthesis protein TsaE n=1 Tax=Mesobaculum littorinae TaxID=2486419 RepID=A0A438AHD2_9RHOB|nr:tRNA (adenosine(37)-N6)-threonylcarbamoyltransferase complex ATPase subunit type 1 TsaE [Mesobaculum littorinae]RVV97997.1 tRNA (adenosine(37)-N6)-threonylcarbamoyltransferase complex ATPase subunit type 1 TsaE [Mesobaculum littorinae]
MPAPLPASSPAPLFAIALSSPDRTAELAHALAPHLGAGDTLLLDGTLGAGKSHFARSLIRWHLDRAGLAEDIPSPTFTLVQNYHAGGLEIWHSDLYRLGDPDEVFELGLDEAFATALVLVEWPDRLGADTPDDALQLAFEVTGDTARRLTVRGGGAWADRLAAILPPFMASAGERA